jgi:hypothetical protein
MSFWLEAERVDERLCGLLRANQGRDDKTVDWKIGEERGKKLGLTVPDVSEHWVVNAASIEFPLGLSVSDEDQFHIFFFVLTATRSTAMAVGPTATVPMASEVRCIDGDSDNVACARRYVLVASGAQVGLGCFVRLHAPDLNFETHRVAFRFVPHVNRRTPK